MPSSFRGRFRAGHPSDELVTVCDNKLYLCDAIGVVGSQSASQLERAAATQRALWAPPHCARGTQLQCVLRVACMYPSAQQDGIFVATSGLQWYFLLVTDGTQLQATIVSSGTIPTI